MKTARFLVAAAALAVAGPALAQLRAGAAKIDITTPASEFPFVFEREKPFVGVHDPVFARALVLENAGRRIAIVTLDLTAVQNPAGTVKALAEAAGVPPSHLMIAASHTHSVPSTFFHGTDEPAPWQRERARVLAGAVKAVRDAVAALRPATVAFKRGEAHVNMNNGESVGLKGWLNPKGFSDKSLDLVRVAGADGKPIALMLNYANHAEVMFRSVTKDGGYEITGDLTGATAAILETQDKGAPVVLFTPAAEGDQLALFKSAEPAPLLPVKDQGVGGWTLLDLLARRLASSTLQALEKMPAGSAAPKLSAAIGTATCPGQKYNVERPSGKVLGIEDTGPVEVPIQAIRIGDIALAGVAGDVASEIGASIKKASPVANTSVVTMLPGAIGYILADDAYKNAGHGVVGSKLKPGCAAGALSQGLSKLLKDMK